MRGFVSIKKGKQDWEFLMQSRMYYEGLVQPCIFIREREMERELDDDVERGWEQELWIIKIGFWELDVEIISFNCGN